MASWYSSGTVVDLEENDLSDFTTMTATNGTNSVISSWAAFGTTYAYRATTTSTTGNVTGAKALAVGARTGNLYIHFWFQIESLGGGTGEFPVFSIASTATALYGWTYSHLAMAVQPNNGDTFVYICDSGRWVDGWYLGSLSTGVTYELELRYDKSGTNVVGQCWFNGVLQTVYFAGGTTFTGSGKSALNSNYLIVGATGGGTTGVYGTMRFDEITCNDAKFTDQKLFPTGKSSSATIGTPGLAPGTATLLPSGKASSAAIGTPGLAPGEVSITTTGLASGASIGAPTLSQGVADQYVTPTGLTSTAALGDPSLSPGAVSIAPSGITSTAAIGDLALLPGAVVIEPSGVPSTAELGAVTVVPGAVTVAPSGITSTSSVGEPTLLPGAVIIAPTGLSSGLTIGVPELLPGGVVVSPSGVTSTAVIGDPALVAGEVVIQPTGLSSTASIGTVTFGLGGVVITPSGVESTAVIGEPVLIAGYIIAVDGVASTAAIGTAVLIAGTATIETSGVESTITIGNPVVYLEAEGPPAATPMMGMTMTMRLIK